jgi:transforming growth factor-beta-induced protein
LSYQNDERGLRSSSHQVQRRNGAGSNVKGKRSQVSKNKQENRRLSKKSKEPDENFLQFLIKKKDFEGIFELLVRAVFAGFLETGGPFTLFAPTNNAFKNLPEGTTDLLFKNKKFLPHLRRFLANHLLGAELFTEQITENLVVGTLANEAIQFNIDPLTGDILVNGIIISKTDERVVNGVVQEIDSKALSPSWVFASLTDRAGQIGELSIFLRLIINTGVDLTLSQSGEFTLLAPVDSAFASLSESTQTCLLAEANILILTEVLLFHVLEKEVLLLADFEDKKKYKTLSKGKVKATRDPLRFEGTASVFDGFGDILANNGVVHVIDTVLDPEGACAF